MFYTIAIRLHPGQDLLAELDRLAKERNLEAACIMTCVGSLTEAVIRYANRENSVRVCGHFEIVSLTGTISTHGSHCHISIADGNGVTSGGHLLEGCKVYTTSEIVVGVLPDCRFLRVHDNKTGYPELEITQA